MKLILHIGQSKTGTTALQSCLRANQEQLARQNILYPDYYIGGMPLHIPNHNSMAEALSGFIRHPGYTADQYFDQFLGQMKNTACDTMILSAESFFGAPQIWRFDNKADFDQAQKRKLERLATLTKDFDTHVIGYFRPPEEWIETAVAHIIRYSGLFAQKVSNSDEELFELLKPHLDYPKFLTLWQKILKPAHMTIVPYDKDRLMNRDVIHDFFARLDIETKDLNIKSPEKDSNKSLDRRYVAVKKELNKKQRSKTSERVIIECLDYLNARKNRIEKYKISPDLKQKIASYCAPCHQWMTEHYAQDGQDFFKPSPKEANEPNPITNAEFDQAMQEFQALYRSWPIKWLGFKIGSKAFLRDNHPRLYALIKNLVGKIPKPHAFLRFLRAQNSC